MCDCPGQVRERRRPAAVSLPKGLRPAVAHEPRALRCPNFDMFAAARMDVSQAGNRMPRVVGAACARPLLPKRLQWNENVAGGVAPPDLPARKETSMASDNAMASLVLICATLAIAAAVSGAFWL
jgi:hypothetical protein